MTPSLARLAGAAIHAGVRPDLLGDVLCPQVRVVRLERSHHVNAPLIIQDHHLNPA